MTTTTLPSLGQSAHLGSLYDARNNRFFAGAIVFSNPPETDVIPSESRRIELTIVTSDTTSEKCKSLNCDAELSAGILSHAIPVEGSAKFLLFNRNANNASTASIVCQIRWMNETLKYLGLNEECVKREIIEGTKATHVVVGIEWGVNAILKVSYSATSNDSGADAKAKVKAQLSFIKANLEGNAGAANMQKESSKNMEFSLYADAEIDTLLPTTADEALDAIRKVAKYKPTNGKGTQLKYVLAPIDDIRRHYKIAGVSQVAHGLNMKIVQRAIDILNKYEASEQKLGDFLETITTNDEFTPHAVLSEAQSTLKNLENGQSHFRVDLRAKMFDCKTDKKNEADFEKLIESAEKYYEELKIQPFLSANEQLIVKFAYVRELKMQNVTVIGNNPGGRNFDQVHRENSGGKEYALFFDFGERGTKAYEDNVMLFNKTVCEAASGGEKIACVAVDLQVVTSDLPDAIRSLALSEQPQQRTRIFYSDNGRVITQNFAASENVYADSNERKDQGQWRDAALTAIEDEVLGPKFSLTSIWDSGTNAKGARAAHKILTTRYPNWRWLVMLADCKIGSSESQPPSAMLDAHHVASRHFNARSGLHTAKTYYLFRSKQQLQGSNRLEALKNALDKINVRVGDALDILQDAKTICQPYADIVSAVVLFCGPKLYNRVVEGDISIIAQKFTVDRLDMTLLITLK